MARLRNVNVLLSILYMNVGGKYDVRRLWVTLFKLMIKLLYYINQGGEV